MENDNKKIDFATILASSVHDMKNSLAMLLGSLEGISSECKTENCSTKNELLRIQHEGQRVNRDLIQLLTLYKIDQSQHHLNIEEVNIYDFLEEIILDYRHLLSERGIDMILDCDANFNGFFDAELVAGVLKTIINNAYQYAGDKIIIGAELIDGLTRISILDNGKGYPTQMLFDPTAQNRASNFSTGSTGLGLYFASQVAELHKNKNQRGFIKITNLSEPNSSLTGGCFSIYLP